MYGFGKELKVGFEEAIEKVKAELKKEGFGILTEIDVKKTLKEKLNVDFKKYQILGACNPPYAYKVLQEEEEIGLMLPCNVIVYEAKGGKTKVSIIDPEKMVESTGNKKLGPIAKEVREKLIKVLEAL